MGVVKSSLIRDRIKFIDQLNAVISSEFAADDLRRECQAEIDFQCEVIKAIRKKRFSNNPRNSYE